MENLIEVRRSQKDSGCLGRKCCRLYRVKWQIWKENTDAFAPELLRFEKEVVAPLLRIVMQACEFEKFVVAHFYNFSNEKFRTLSK